MASRTRDLSQPLTGIEQAVAAVGGQRALAEKLRSFVEGYDYPSQQAVSLWVRRGWVPNARVVEVAEVSGVDPVLLMAPELRAAIEPSLARRRGKATASRNKDIQAN